MSNPAILTARELATHAADIEHLQRDVDKIMADMEEIKRSIAQISATLSEARGGWKVFMLIGGASGGTVGAALVQAVHYFMGK
jgi:hypothetical protein